MTDSRVFYISLGKTVTISGLTITQGKADLVGDFFFGGGIYNDHSTLTLSNCTLSRNSAQSGGGGIYNDHSTLTLSNCALSGNSAGDGGGIFNDGRSGGRATLSITNSTFDDNWSRTRGGGILNTGGGSGGRATLSIINSTLNGNRASSEGGGIYNAGVNDGTAMLTVSNSTLSGNRARRQGAAFTTRGAGNTGRCATLSTINNSTLSGNSSGFVGGGGILNDHATLTVSNSTLSGNSGGWRNGNVILNKQATLEIGDTILKAETSNTNILNDRGRITSFGYNLSSDNGGGVLTGPGDQINTDPMLGPLQDNGGPTLTHAPLIGSPAINTGDPNFTPPPDFDERGAGYPRVVNGRLDIGAIEVQAPPNAGFNTDTAPNAAD